MPNFPKHFSERRDLEIALTAAALILPAATLSFDGLTSFGNARLLVVAAPLQLAVQAFSANHSLELVDSSTNIVVDYRYLYRSQIVGFRS